MISTLKEKESGSGNDVDSAELSLYMMQVIKELNDERKLPAVHVYLCTLHSFVRFSGGGELLMSVDQQEISGGRSIPAFGVIRSSLL